ncbi:MAG: hypothetical protein Q8S15_05625 [Erysipelotrichaceae bacterium]|nr:hypothetical protein [Erysipelotrichaceae bacterium]
MKIQRTPEIDNFFKNCMDNLKKENKNRFLSAKVTNKNESYLQKQMGKSGFQEFMKPKEQWPSLFIRSSDAIQRPYNSTITLDMIKNDDFRFSLEMIPANQLFNVSGIIFDQHRELNDWMQLRALDQPYPAAVLWQGDDVWMLDAPSESFTIDPYAKKAKGDVLTFGLGIGYFTFMALLNPSVQSVTIVERSVSVIAMFNEYILPQFPQRNKVKIIEADAFDCYNETFINQFDYVFVDIWKSGDDGFLMIEKLLEQYEPPFEKVDFWIETSCFEFIPTLIFLYFNSLAYEKNQSHQNALYKRILSKIERYFASEDINVSDVGSLKDRMYDLRTLRKIISDQ